MPTDKTVINLVVIGYSESGKSTTTGRMIYKCGRIEEETIDNFEMIAQERGQENYKYSWILDKLKADKDSGFNTNMDLMKFETPNFNVTVIDAPGNKYFIKNMISGIIRPDCFLLIVSAKDSEFENGFNKNDQTKEQARLAFSLGLKTLIVGVNKMDSTEPPFDKDRFNVIKNSVSIYLKQVGYQLESVFFVPISGLAGDNVVEESKNMDWYRGWEVKREENDEEIVVRCNTIIDAINSMKMPIQPWEKPFRLAVQDFFEIEGNGTVSVGRVETGIIRPEMLVTFSPRGLTVKVESVKIDTESVTEARPMDEVRLITRNVLVNDIWRGNVCSDYYKDPARQAINFTALVIVMNHSNPIIKGYTPMLDCHAASIGCEISDLLKKIDGGTGVVIQTNPNHLEPGDIALVKMIPTMPMCVETFAEYPPLGRFAARDRNNDIVMVGIITFVTKKPANIKKIKKFCKDNPKIKVRVLPYFYDEGLEKKERPIGFV